MGSGDLGGVGEVEFWRAEAKRLAVENVVLQTRVADLEGQVGALAEKVSVLARLAFGTSSEKAKQAPGGDGAAGEAGNDPAGGPDEAWPWAAAGRARTRPPRLLPSAGPRGGPRRSRGRAGVPALRRGLCPVRRGVLRADRLAGPADPDRAPPPDLPAHLRLPGPRRAGRPTGAQGHRQGPVHHRVSGPAAGGEVRAGPARAPDRRRAGPRRARPGRGHPGRGVRGVLGPAGPTGRS